MRVVRPEPRSANPARRLPPTAVSAPFTQTRTRLLISAIELIDFYASGDHVYSLPGLRQCACRARNEEPQCSYRVADSKAVNCTTIRASRTHLIYPSSAEPYFKVQHS
jgi:hypothetical protein